MSNPEVKVTIDKYGHVVYKATEEAVLLSKDEKEFIIDRFASLQAENAKLRELVKRMHRHIRQTCGECDGWYCSNFDEDNECCVYDTLARELGIEVTP